MKILITGAKGFIGSHLTKAFPQTQTYDKQDGADLCDKNTLNMCMSKCNPDTVIHLAANATVGSGLGQDIQDNIIGTHNLLEACKKHNVKKIVFTSSAAVYGNKQYDSEENAYLNPISSYGITKWMCEKMIKLYCKDRQMKYCILRFSNVYGPKGRGIINKILKDLKAPITMCGGLQERDFIHVTDIVQAIKTAVNYEGTYNICTGKSITMNNLVKLIETITKQKLQVAYTGYNADDIMTVPMINTKARNELGWKPAIDLADGIKQLWKDK